MTETYQVTESSIQAKIGKVEYAVYETSTVCYVTMKNGFVVVGSTGVVDPSNFNKEDGEKYSYENAFRRLWALEGYLLRDKMWQDNQQKLAA